MAPLSALGSVIGGGRYNRSAKYDLSNAFEALYLADTHTSALEEVEAMVGGIPHRMAPRLMLSIDVDLTRIVDLRSTIAHHSLGARIVALTAPWRRAQVTTRTITQEIGLAAHTLGLEGLLVPSAKNHAHFNLVVFPANLLRSSLIEVYTGPPGAVPRIAADRLTGHR
jgi:RES domain-containing protein